MKSMENIVYNELLVCGYNVDVGIVDVMAKNVDGNCARWSYRSTLPFLLK